MSVRVGGIIASGFLGTLIFCATVSALVRWGPYHGIYPMIAQLLAMLALGWPILLPLSLVVVVPWRWFQDRYDLNLTSDLIASLFISLVVVVTLRLTHSADISVSSLAAIGFLIFLGNVTTAAFYWRHVRRHNLNDQRRFVDARW